MDYYAPYRKALSQSQMEVNAVWLRNYLQNRGWSLNAIAAALGNWQSECTLNPNRPQRADFPKSSGGGFGLPQWTPWKKKYGAWCQSQGIQIQNNDYNPAGRFEPQIEYHDYECRFGLNGKATWYNNKGYHYKWDQWKTSLDSPDTLAIAYYWQYERSGANAPGSRPQNALRWYQYLSGQPFTPIPGGRFSPFPGMQTGFSIGSLRFLYIWLLLMILSRR